MPTIASRMVSREAVDRMVLEAPRPRVVPPTSPSTTSFSLTGNPAPLRGEAPPELSNDIDKRHFFPDGPYFRRGFVDSTIYVRNLALQALNP